MAGDLGSSRTSERRFIGRVLIVIGLVALALLLWEIRGILMMVFGAIVVATLFRSLADTIRDHSGLPGGVSLLLSVLIILGTIIGSILLFGGQIATQMEGLQETIPKAWDYVRGEIEARGLGEELDQLTGQGMSSGVTTFARNFAMSVGSGLMDTVLIAVAGLFIASQPKFYAVGMVKLIPEERRESVTKAMVEGGNALKLWLKAQLLLMLIVGVATGVGLWLLGVPSALALGILAGLLEFIPYVGPILAAVPAVLMALSVDPQLALWAAMLAFVIQQLESYALAPLIQQWAVELPGAILLFSLLVFGSLFGPLGVIFAAPLTVVCYVLIKRLYVREVLATPTPIPGHEPGDKAVEEEAKELRASANEPHD